MVSEVRLYRLTTSRGLVRNVTLHLEEENPLMNSSSPHLMGGIESEKLKHGDECIFLVSPPQRAHWIILYKHEGGIAFCNIDVY